MILALCLSAGCTDNNSISTDVTTAAETSAETVTLTSAQTEAETTGETSSDTTTAAEETETSAEDIQTDREAETSAETAPTAFSETDAPFYGVWTGSFTEKDESFFLYVDDLRHEGYDPFCIYTPDWENMSSEPYFCLCAGKFGSQEDAEKLLDEVKAAGHSDAYIKYTGERIAHRCMYYSYSISDMEFTPDKVILKDVQVDDFAGESLAPMTLIIDSDTVFADNAEFDTFTNYTEGQTVLEWFNHNNELLETDTDAYLANGPALSGVFEISITDDHIDSFYGSYWWD